MFFVGTHELSIDAKNRLSIPFGLRTKLNPETDGRSFYVMPGRRRETLWIYPDVHFENLHKAQPTSDDVSDATYEFLQFQYSHTVLVDQDSQGRILIPDRLLKLAGLDKEAILIGVRDHMELWNRPAFEDFGSQYASNYPQHRADALKELKEHAAEDPAPAATAPAADD